MGGPNLEIFKFSLYLFVPIAALIHFGDPAWYRNNVIPVTSITPYLNLCLPSHLQYRDKLFPPEKTVQAILHSYKICLCPDSKPLQSFPTDPQGVRAELERIKAERLAKRTMQQADAKDR